MSAAAVKRKQHITNLRAAAEQTEREAHSTGNEALLLSAEVTAREARRIEKQKQLPPGAVFELSNPDEFALASARRRKAIRAVYTEDQPAAARIATFLPVLEDAALRMLPTAFLRSDLMSALRQEKTKDKTPVLYNDRPVHIQQDERGRIAMSQSGPALCERHRACFSACLNLFKERPLEEGGVAVSFHHFITKTLKKSYSPETHRAVREQLLDLAKTNLRVTFSAPGARSVSVPLPPLLTLSLEENPPSPSGRPFASDMIIIRMPPELAALFATAGAWTSFPVAVSNLRGLRGLVIAQLYSRAYSECWAFDLNDLHALCKSMSKTEFNREFFGSLDNRKNGISALLDGFKSADTPEEYRILRYKLEGSVVRIWFARHKAQLLH